MPQSLSKVLLHIIFSTKNRKESIPQTLRAKLYAYMAGVCRQRDVEAYRIGGTNNHVHIACSLPRTITIAKLVEEIKKPSSIWMKQQDGGESNFAWQAGYGVFSLGQSQLTALVTYIDNQEEHHKTKTFKEELFGFLEKYNIDYDERYLWD
jgi:REP element-mobilizing transposase RayT